VARRHNKSPIALLRFARAQGRLGRDESAKLRAASGTTLRRTVPSFTVEVRRRPRLAATSRPNEQSLETKPLPAAFERELHPAEAATMGAKKADQSSVDVSAPKGRILPTLVADEPPGRLFRDASLSATESEPTLRVRRRRSVRPVKGSTSSCRRVPAIACRSRLRRACAAPSIIESRTSTDAAGAEVRHRGSGLYATTFISTLQLNMNWDGKIDRTGGSCLK
jgi:hypothetical protein